MKLFKITHGFAKYIRRNLISASLLSSNLPIDNNKMSFTYLPNFKMSTEKSLHKSFRKTFKQGEGYYLQQMYISCLSIYSYYIESEGQVAIIDPENNLETYAKVFQERKTQPKYILLTHFHADFVSGHNDFLKKYPDCQIIMGPRSESKTLKINTLKDGEQFKLGNIKIKALHTPGHTEQSTCYMLLDKNNKEQDLFSGDTLFLGQVGRPDLAVKSNLTSKDLAGMLFDSLQKLKKLPDTINVYPGHGAGSACGKNIGKGDFCTLGTQKLNNYALKFQEKEQFSKEILKGMPQPPQYFFNVVSKNKQDPFQSDQAYSHSNKALTINEFKNEANNKNTVIIDIRGDNKNFIEGTTIKDAYVFGHKGKFADFVGQVINPSKNILLLGEQKDCQDAIRRLIRIGYLNIKGYNSFKVEQWKDTIKYPVGTIEELKQVQSNKLDYTILDLRTDAECQAAIYSGKRKHIPIAALQKRINQLSNQQIYLIHCASGYRSKIAANILQQNGLKYKLLIQPFDFYKNQGAEVIKPKN